MKHIFNIITVIAALLVTSCVKEGDYSTEYNPDFKTNYEAFWNFVNENYCFLGDNYGYCKMVGGEKLDWNKVKEEMMPKVEAAATEEDLFDIMGKSIDYLQDGHVWIDSKFNHRGCFTFYNIAFPNEETYPKNFISGLITNQNSKILDYVYRTRNGHRYGTITRGDKKFFYLHHSDFTKDLNKEDLEMFKPHLEKADGFIYDIRTNPGGSAQLSFNIAGRFVKNKTLVGYQVIKDGKGHNDLTEPSAIYIVPSQDGYNWTDMNTVVLTNRDVYSTANMFASYMKEVPNATIIGGITGGGGGDPCTFYLPNGWAVTMSGHRMVLDVNKVHIEAGVKPDIQVDITEEDMANNYDRILEKAIEELSK